MLMIDRAEVEPFTGQLRVRVAGGAGFMREALDRIRGLVPSSRNPHPHNGEIVELGDLRRMTGSGLGPQTGRLVAIDGSPGEYRIVTVEGDTVVEV